MRGVAVLAALMAAPALDAAPGDLDPSFGNGGKVLAQVPANVDSGGQAMVVQPDGKYLVAGYAYSPRRFALARFNTNGSLDAGFGTGGSVLTTIGTDASIATSLALQSDGKIIVAGYTESFVAGLGYVGEIALVRYTPSGELDASFGGGDGIVTTALLGYARAYSVAMQPDGRIVVTGSVYTRGQVPEVTNLALLRFLSTGELDTGFGSAGVVLTAGLVPEGRKVLVLPDGRILVAGFEFRYSGTESGYWLFLARYTSTGALLGIADARAEPANDRDEANYAFDATLQPDGKVLLAGYAQYGTSNGSLIPLMLVRFTGEGELDPGFGTNGVVLTWGVNNQNQLIGRSVAVQPDGKIVVAVTDDTQAFVLFRYLSNGTLDASFGGGDGKVSTFLGAHSNEAHGVAIQADGKIVLAGSAFQSGFKFALARYEGDPSPYQLWAQSAGLTGQESDALASPHRDGVANLLKFAFNMNAAAPDVRTLEPGTGTAGLPAIDAAGTPAARTLRLEYLRRIGSGLSYQPLKSPSLNSGAWLPLTSAPIIVPVDSTWERVIHEEPVTGERFFVRVQVGMN